MLHKYKRPNSNRDLVVFSDLLKRKEEEEEFVKKRKEEKKRIVKYYITLCCCRGKTVRLQSLLELLC